MGLIKIICIFVKFTFILTLKSKLMKKISFLILVILCLASLDIYSSQQELKFDAIPQNSGENGNSRSDYGPPGEGDQCWYFGGAGCVKFSLGNCAAEANNKCEGVEIRPGQPE